MFIYWNQCAMCGQFKERMLLFGSTLVTAELRYMVSIQSIWKMNMRKRHDYVFILGCHIWWLAMKCSGGVLTKKNQTLTFYKYLITILQLSISDRSFAIRKINDMKIFDRLVIKIWNALKIGGPDWTTMFCCCVVSNIWHAVQMQFHFQAVI